MERPYLDVEGNMLESAGKLGELAMGILDEYQEPDCTD